MEYWTNKVAVITNCGNEIGTNIIEKIGQTGMTVIGLCKNRDEMKYIADELNNFNSMTVNLILNKIDVENNGEIEAVFKDILNKYGTIDILINILKSVSVCTVTEEKFEDLKKLVDTNVSDIVAYIRMAAASMIQKQNRGHIMTICDSQGVGQLNKNLFTMTKAAVSSINEILRLEFRYLKANIKTTYLEIDSSVKFDELSKNKPIAMKKIAQMVITVLNTPEHLHIHELWLDIKNE